jgi:protein-tyrosine-phosphatase
VKVASAGTFAVEGAPASRGAVEAARRRGADLSFHQSRRVDSKTVQEADLLIAMSPAHLRVLLDHPGAEDRAHLLTDFLPAGHAQRGTGVADPFGGDAAEYERAAQTIETCVAYLLDGMEDS